MAAPVRSPTTKWTDGSAPTVQASEWEGLDAAAFGLVNGVEGGTWAPAVAIEVDGDAFDVSGPTVISGADGVLAITNDGVTGGDISHEDGDYSVLGTGHSGATRVILSPCALGTIVRPVPPSGAPIDIPFATREGGLQFMAHSYDGGAGGVVQSRAMVPLRVHNGALVASVALKFRVSGTHSTTAPVTMPKARVIRSSVAGVVEALTSTAAGADADGYVSVAAVTTGPAWYASGAAQTLTITCDQNRDVDVGTYAYHVEIVEEQGLTGYPWGRRIVTPCAALYAAAGAVPVGLGAFDGYTPSAGDRILCPGLTAPGVYVAAVGAWTEAEVGPSMTFAETDTGMLIFVVNGDTYGKTLWHSLSTPTTFAASGLVFSTRREMGQPDAPGYIHHYGTTWYAAKVTMTGIADTRFQ